MWQRWVADRDTADRERLILHYAPLVKYVAGRCSVGVSGAVDLSDLISAGVLGLIDAIERYDPTRGVRFEAYAVSRIRGAIFDELRAIDWVPRAVRDGARVVRDGLEELEAQRGRTPSEHELALHLDMSVDRLRHLLGQMSLTSLAALDDLFVDADGSGRLLSDTLHDPTAIDPETRAERSELRAALAAAVDRLPDRERALIMLYYVEGMTLAQIGEVLGVSGSRVSQLHSMAVLALRSKLAVRSLAGRHGT